MDSVDRKQWLIDHHPPHGYPSPQKVIFGKRIAPGSPLDHEMRFNPDSMIFIDCVFESPRWARAEFRHRWLLHCSIHGGEVGGEWLFCRMNALELIAAEVGLIDLSCCELDPTSSAQFPSSPSGSRQHVRLMNTWLADDALGRAHPWALDPRYLYDPLRLHPCWNGVRAWISPEDLVLRRGSKAHFARFLWGLGTGMPWRGVIDPASSNADDFSRLRQSLQAWRDASPDRLFRVDREREVYFVAGVNDGYGAAWLDDDDRCHLRVSSFWYECLVEHGVELDVPSILSP